MTERRRNPDHDRNRYSARGPYGPVHENRPAEHNTGFDFPSFARRNPQHVHRAPPARVAAGVGYIGDGNYSSGDYGSDGPADYDYSYAGFKGDAGMDEYGDSQYGGGRYGQGPFEQSQQYGGDGFSSGRGPFGRLQRQYEHRFVAGGHRGSYGDHDNYAGREDSGNKQRPHERRWWPEDTGNRRWDEGSYYAALSYDDESGVNRRYSGFREDQAEGFSLTELGGASDWHSAPDIADPAGYRIYRAGADDGPQSDPRTDQRLARRGPKGYRRSDERILEDIYEHLLPTTHLDASDVRIEVHDSIATLTGTVPARRMKHAIEDLVHSLRDVRDVENRIRVQQRTAER
jgi:hypothetical protein